jgi:hypothetical protein
MAASQLINGEQQFCDGNGVPYAGGSVYFYVYDTSTLANTWQDPNEVTLNTNPVILDADGRATIWGDGQYRQVLFDQFGNEIWDKPVFSLVTSDEVVTSFNGRTGDVTLSQSDVNTAIGTDDITNAMLAYMPGMTVKGNNGGSPGPPQDLTIAQITAMLAASPGAYYSVDTGTVNVIVATLPTAPSALTAGLFLFVQVENTNTSSVTLNVNGLGAENVQYNGANVKSGYLQAGQIYLFCYDGTQFELISPPSLLGSSGGDTSVTLPGASSAAGTVGSSGWYYDGSGILHQWAYVQLQDNDDDTPVTWDFPITFPTAALGAYTTNVCEWAGQTGSYAPRATASLASMNTTSMGVVLRNTAMSGTLCAFYLEAWGR